MSPKLVLYSILLAVFVVPSSISGTAIALPYIAQKLGSDSALLQWVVNAFNLFFACFTLIWGAISDRLGAKHCLCAGVALYLLASLLSAVAPTLLWLNIARACAGIGGASVFACGSVILMQTFSANEHSKVFAAFGTTAGLGITLGPTISGFLIDIFAYQAIFIFHFMILAVVLLLIVRLPKIEPEKQASHFDSFGVILFLMFMLSLMLVIMNLSHFKDFSTFILLIFCILMGIAFVYQQKKVSRNQAPFLDISILNNLTFCGFALVTIIAGFSFVVLLTYFPTFLFIVLDISASWVGVLMLALTSPMLFCPILAARFLNHGVNPKVFAFITSLMMSLGIFLLLATLMFFNGMTQNITILLTLFIIGCGMGLHAGAIDKLALSSVDSSKIGFAAGMLNFLRLGSESIGVALYAAFMLVFIMANSHDSLQPLVLQIASGHLPLIEALELYHQAIEVYTQAFYSSMIILGFFSLILSGAVWVLLSKRQGISQ